MSLETIALIIVLTLLALNLGIEFFILIMTKLIFKDFSEISRTDFTRDLSVLTESSRKVIDNIDLRINNLMFCLSCIVLIWAIVLNITPNWHSESYLLTIGLISLVLYFILLLGKFIDRVRAIRLDLKIKLLEIIEPQPQKLFYLLPGLPLILILVSYWSFIHYALNPKI